MSRLPSPLLALAFLASGALAGGCAADAPAEPPAAPAPPPAPAVPATWTTTASAYRGQTGTRLVFACPPNPTQAGAGRAWGTDTYTDDSAVCVAAVHAGAITYAEGGRVAVEILPGRGGYPASTRNGVESGSWGAWSGSFVVSAG